MEYKQAKIELEAIGRELHAYLDKWKKEGFTRTQDFIRYAVKAIDMQQHYVDRKASHCFNSHLDAEKNDHYFSLLQKYRDYHFAFGVKNDGSRIVGC